MGNLGIGEILLIVLVLLLVFGSSRLPALGDALGKALRNFRKSRDEPPAGPRDPQLPPGPPRP